MDNKEKGLLINLIRHHRWAGLATVNQRGEPNASMVSYVSEPDLFGQLLLLSKLSQHTRNLLSDPQASLVISSPDPLEGDPQTLARVTLTGAVTVIERETTAWEVGKARYLTRLPDSARLFGFKDFVLFRFEPKKARHIGGFARAFSIKSEALRKLLSEKDSNV